MANQPGIEYKLINYWDNPSEVTTILTVRGMTASFLLEEKNNPGAPEV